MVSYMGCDLGAGDALLKRLRAGLLGTRPFPLARHHRIAVDFLVDAHDRSPPADAAPLSHAVASLLTDPDPLVRSGAIRFFQASTAREAAALRAALSVDGGRFEGVPDPLPGATGDLRHELARAAARRLADDPALRQLIRDEALRPGRASTVIAALGLDDVAWLEAHACDIAAVNHDALDPLLYTLRSAGEDLESLVQALRSRVPPDLLRAAVDSLGPAGHRRATP